MTLSLIKLKSLMLTRQRGELMKQSNKLSITKKLAITVIFLRNSMTEKAINSLQSPRTLKRKVKIRDQLRMRRRVLNSRKRHLVSQTTEAQTIMR